MRLSILCSSIFLVSCAHLPGGGKPNGAGESAGTERTAPSVRTFLGAVLVPGIAIAERIASNKWPTAARMDELLDEAGMTIGICGLLITQLAIDRYLIDYGVSDSAIEHCPETFVAKIERLEGAEECFRYSVQPARASTGMSTASMRSNAICDSDLSSLVISFGPALPGADQANEENLKKVGGGVPEQLRERLIEVLRDRSESEGE